MRSSLSPAASIVCTYPLSFSLIHTYMRTHISHMGTHFFSFLLPSLFFSFTTKRSENTVDTAFRCCEQQPTPSYTAADSTLRRKYQIIGMRKRMHSCKPRSSSLVHNQFRVLIRTDSFFFLSLKTPQIFRGSPGVISQGCRRITGIIIQLCVVFIGLFQSCIQKSCRIFLNYNWRSMNNQSSSLSLLLYIIFSVHNYSYIIDLRYDLRNTKSLSVIVTILKNYNSSGFSNLSSFRKGYIHIYIYIYIYIYTIFVRIYT